MTTEHMPFSDVLLENHRNLLSLLPQSALTGCLDRPPATDAGPEQRAATQYARSVLLRAIGGTGEARALFICAHAGIRQGLALFILIRDTVLPGLIFRLEPDPHAEWDVCVIDADDHRIFEAMAAKVLAAAPRAIIATPSAFAAHMPTATAPKVALLGYPGCGNGIFNALADRILAGSPEPLSHAERLMNAAAIRHRNLFLGFLVDALQLGPPSEWSVIQEQHPYAQVMAAFPGVGHLHVRGLDFGYRHQLTSASSHSLLTPWLVREARLRNRVVAMLSRDPLDLLASRLRKEGWLDEPKKARRTAQFLTTYYDCERPSGGFLRYEDLLADPVAMIRRLAEMLDREVDVATARAWWAEIGMRNLDHMPDDHFRGGGVGGGRSVLPPDIASDPHLRLVSRRLGYAEEDAGDPINVPPFFLQPAPSTQATPLRALSTGVLLLRAGDSAPPVPPLPRPAASGSGKASLYRDRDENMMSAHIWHLELLPGEWITVLASRPELGLCALAALHSPEGRRLLAADRLPHNAHRRHLGNFHLFGVPIDPGIWGVQERPSS